MLKIYIVYFSLSLFLLPQPLTLRESNTKVMSWGIMFPYSPLDSKLRLITWKDVCKHFLPS